MKKTKEKKKEKLKYQARSGFWANMNQSKSSKKNNHSKKMKKTKRRRKKSRPGMKNQKTSCSKTDVMIT